MSKHAELKQLRAALAARGKRSAMTRPWFPAVLWLAAFGCLLVLLQLASREMLSTGWVLAISAVVGSAAGSLYTSSTGLRAWIAMEKFMDFEAMEERARELEMSTIDER